MNILNKSHSVLTFWLIIAINTLTFKSSFAQIDIVLDSPTTGTYSASRSITLLPGFSTTDFDAHINSAAPVITQAPSTDQNFVLSNTARIPGLTAASQLNGLTANQLQQTVTYYDGIGRPTQVIGTQAGTLYRDIVQPIIYDATGKESRNYLPYVDTSIGNGSYKNVDILQTVTNYYNNPSTGKAQDDGIETISYPFSDNKKEASVLNRLQEQGFPGADWQLGNKTQKASYLTNGTNEVAVWAVNSNGADGSNYYLANTLYKTTVTDENGNSSSIFKDVQNRVVLSQLQGSSGYQSTYYVYDDMGHLRYIIPPLPNGLPSTFTSTDPVFLNYIYAYNYDTNGRIIEKKIPGRDWEYFVYNNINQLILSQDGKERAAGIWAFAKYDNLGRIVYNGELSNAGSRTDLQYAVDGYGGTWGESFTNAATNNGYTNNNYPTIFNTIQTVNYYDNYSYLDNAAINPSATVFTAPSPAVDTLLQQPYGMLTGSKTNVLGTADYLLATAYYDTYERNVQVITQNYKGGTASDAQYDKETIAYSFTNRPIKIVHEQHVSSGNSIIIQDDYSYDQADRLLVTKERYNNGTPVTLARYDYNALGQLIAKHQHSTSSDALPGASTFFQHFAYQYNSRGWLSQINNPDNLNDATYGSNSTDVFALRLHYNDAYSGSTGRWNGDITAAEWQTKLPQSATITQEKKAFLYGYDQSGQLTSASYRNNSGAYNGQFNEQIGYDITGNISTLQRTNTTTSGQFLNNLTYNYGTGVNRGNQLLSVSDAGTEGYNSTYTYDENGNVKTDAKKEITGTGITYNDLDLPSHVQFSNGKTIDYIYDATGTMLRRVIKLNGAVQEARDYINGVEYTDANGLEYIYNQEGRALPQTTGSGIFINEYIATDQLGSIRALYGDKNSNGVLDAGDVLQVSDYYPFGREINYGTGMPSYPENQYAFNGKELQTDLTQYDYGARFYDPIIARWHVPDPMAEDYAGISPYHYGLNNPVNTIDPTGMLDWYLPNGSTDMDQAVWFDGSGDIDGYQHLGLQGWGIDELTGLGIWFGSDGVKSSFMNQLNEVNINASRPASSMIANTVDIGLNFVPIAGSGRDLYRGISDGNWMQAALGAGGLALDIATLGGASLAEGAIKTGVKELAEVGTKELIEEGANKALTNDQLVKRAAEFADEFVTTAKNPGALGTAKHEAATELLERYQNIYGDRGLKFKQYFNNEAILGLGNKGFLDVVDHANQKIYDFKFGKAQMGNSQLSKYMRNFSGYIIQTIKP